MLSSKPKEWPKGWIKSPTNLKARLCGSQTELIWQYDGGKLYPVHPTGFYVFKSKTTEFGYPITKVFSPSQDRYLSMSWFDSDMKENETYYYKVQAYYQNQISGYSNLTMIEMSGLLAPSNLTTTRFKETAVKLDWKLNSSSMVNTYIERSVDKEGYRHLVTLRPTMSTYIDAAVEFGKSYRYKVQNQRFTTNSDFSNESNTINLALQELTFLNVKVTSEGIDLKWTATSELADGYEIEKKEDALGSFSAEAKVLKGEETVLMYQDKNVETNKQYCYRIRARKEENGKMLYSSWYEFGMNTFEPEVPKPLGVTSLCYEVENYVVTLNWRYKGATEGFIIERSKTVEGNYKEIASVSANTFGFVDKNVEVDVPLNFYRIKVYKGSEFRYSNIIPVLFDSSPNKIIEKDGMLLGIPELTFCTGYINDYFALLQWSYIGGKIDGFAIKQSWNDTDYKTICYLEKNICNFLYTVEKPCTIYYQLQVHVGKEYRYSNSVKVTFA